MIKYRKKTTATLLIAIFMISMFAVAIPVGAQTTWTVPWHFATIQEAIDSDDVQEGDTILVGEGEWYGGDIDRALIIKGLHGAVIVDGPAYPHRVGEPDGPAHIGFFIEPEGSGCTVESFTFRGGRIGDTENYLDLAVFGRYVSDVTVKSNKILNCSQCISNIFGSNWIITHNIIECVYHWHLLGIYLNGSYGNIISHNEITGEAPVRGQGIELVNGCYNEIVSNTITITGPDAVAIKLRVSGISEDPTPEEIAYAQSVLHDYAIQYNDLRGSTNQFSITPPELEEVNTIDARAPPTPNEPPNSEINGPYSGEVGVSISFSSEESSDSDGSIVEYYWTFGDGAHSYSTNPTYTYQSPGTYTITLRVTDDDGATDATSTACIVESPPQPEPDKPGGIPGFDFASILISLMISILAMWKMSRRMSCAPIS